VASFSILNLLAYSFITFIVLLYFSIAFCGLFVNWLILAKSVVFDLTFLRKYDMLLYYGS